MADIFISYKREDKHLAEDTIQRLKEAGYSVWYDERIDPRTSWDATIEAEIAAAKAVLVLWTARSVASEWVRTEADYAREHGKMIPVKLEACSAPLAYRRVQTADLSNWDGNPSDRNWQKVLEWVRGLVSGAGAQPGGIGPSVSAGGGGAYSEPRRPGGAGLWLGLALVLLVGGAGALWATGVIGPDTFTKNDASELAEAEDTAPPETSGDAPAEIAPVQTAARASKTAPEPETPAAPQAPACFSLYVTADREDANGHNWDVGPAALSATRPDMIVTSASHGDVRLACENSFQCNGGDFANAAGRDSVTLLIMDEDIDANDLMGQGNCAIPSNACRLGGVRVDVRAC